MLHPKKFKVFAAVAQHRSLTKAAAELHLTQPAVSNTIRQLEDHFDCRLLNIVGKTVHLTEAGRVLLTESLLIESAFENCQFKMDAIQKKVTGTLRIAMVSTAKYFLPALMAQYLEHYPDIDFACHIHKRSELLTAIDHHEADIGILTDAPNISRYRQYPFADNPLIMVASPKHPLAKQKIVTFADCCAEPFITRESDAVITRHLYKIFQRYKRPINILFTIDSTEAIKQSVMSNLGISLIPKISVARELANRDLVELNLKIKMPSSRWYLVENSQNEERLLLHNFIDFFRKNFVAVS